MGRYFPNRNLFLLWAGQFVSLSGDYLYQMGLFWWVLDYSGSLSMTGLLGACFFLPTLLFGLYGGVVADRVGYRKVMIWADVFRLAVVSVLVVIFLMDWVTTPALLVMAFLVAGGSAFFNPAKDALIPQLAGGANLLRINAVQQSSWPFSLLLGALLASATIDNPPLLFGLDAFSFLISLGCILKISHRWTPQETATMGTARSRLLADLFEGLKRSWQDKRIFVLLALTAIDNLFIMGPALVGLTIFVKEHLGLPGTYYARMESAYGFGMILSMLIIHALADRIPKGRLLMIGIFFDGLTYVPMFWSNTFWSTYAIFFIHSWAIPMIIVGRTALIQTLVPQGMQGRVFSLSNITVIGMTALSNALTGIVATVIPIHLIFTLIGIGGATCGLIGMLYKPLWRCR